MFLLSIIPDFVFHLILTVGVLGIIAGIVFKFIPIVSQYRLPILMVSGILVTLGVYMEGAISNQAWWKARVAEAETQVLKAEALSAESNAKLAEQLAKNQNLVKENTAFHRQRLSQQATQLNQECKFNQNVIDILNDAAKSRKGVEK